MGENTQLGPRPPSLYSIIKPNMAISLMTCVSADVAIIWMTYRLSIVPPGCRTHGGWWVWPLLTGFQSKNTGSTSLSPRAIWNHFTARVPHRCLDSLRVRLTVKQNGKQQPAGWGREITKTWLMVWTHAERNPRPYCHSAEGFFLLRQWCFGEKVPKTYKPRSQSEISSQMY